jgi:hypothetical protein
VTLSVRLELGRRDAAGAHAVEAGTHNTVVRRAPASEDGTRVTYASDHLLVTCQGPDSGSGWESYRNKKFTGLAQNLQAGPAG